MEQLSEFLSKATVIVAQIGLLIVAIGLILVIFIAAYNLYKLKDE